MASCPDPRTILDATLNVTGLKHPDGSYKLGSRVVYTCNRGYELKSGNARQECIQNKTDSFWSGKLPTCDSKLKLLFLNVVFSFIIVPGPRSFICGI